MEAEHHLVPAQSAKKKAQAAAGQKALTAAAVAEISWTVLMALEGMMAVLN